MVAKENGLRIYIARLPRTEGVRVSIEFHRKTDRWTSLPLTSTDRIMVEKAVRETFGEGIEMKAQYRRWKIHGQDGVSINVVSYSFELKYDEWDRPLRR